VERKRKILVGSSILLAVGLVLFSLGTAQSLGMLVIITADETPPVWTLATDGLPAIAPRDGYVYSKLNKIQAGVGDPESDVVSVSASIDGSAYTLTLYIGTPHSGVWMVVIPEVSAGEHSIHIVATNIVGRFVTYDGTFEIYEGLDGDWYINNIKITDPNQHLFLKTLTLSFKFVRTLGSGPLDCKVSWTGPTTGTISLATTFPETWEKTYTFSKGGTYTMTCVADDSTNQITMSIYNVGLPGGDFEWPELNALQWIGIGVTAAGAICFIKGWKET